MNPFDLTGKVAIVTGGNGGIGLGMAQGLARPGPRSSSWGGTRRSRRRPHDTFMQPTGADTLVVTADVAEPGRRRPRGRRDARTGSAGSTSSSTTPASTSASRPRS